jgi:hypothetical protein
MTDTNYDPIELHIRTYRSLLKSASELKIEKLIDSHNAMKSILHEKGGSDKIDTSSFIYSLLRLPECMSNVKTIILGQSFAVFKKHGYAEIEDWKNVITPGRRRKMYYNGSDTLAVYISSVTDVDDIVTLLTAFQMEWNKFHHLIITASNAESETNKVMDQDDLSKIKKIWDKQYHRFLTAIKYRRVEFTLKLLSGSYVEYAKSTKHWWENIESSLQNLQIQNRPVYFVSSNTHSIANIISRFAVKEESKLIDFLKPSENHNLLQIWEDIKKGKNKANADNFLYYISKKYAVLNPDYLKAKDLAEKQAGIHYIGASHYLDIDTKVIELNKLAGRKLDKRLDIDTKILSESEAVIINIDYPLGWAAYQVLTEIGQNLDGELRGVYIMGKAATLNGEIGDILIPDTVYDEHTKNTYAIKNAFRTSDFRKIFRTGNILDNQKTVSVKGTFFENQEFINKCFKTDFTDIEMEAGPYMNGVYEYVYYNRYIEKEFINISNPPFELGIAHYASDTPNSKAKNLGVRNLSFEGVEPTYAISLAIIEKIIKRESSILMVNG